MLKKLVIKNINSINICEIDFAKANYKFEEDNLLGNLVNPIAIYGHNGSGKSAVFNAMSQFISLMINPAEVLQPFTVNNYLFDRYQRNGKKDLNLVKGSINLFFDINNNEYDYFLETTREFTISREYLIKNKEEYFHRENNNYRYKDQNLTMNSISPLIPLIRALASSEINDEYIQISFAYISSFTHVNVSFINRGAFVTSKIFSNMNINDLLVNKSNEVKLILNEYNNFPSYSVEKNKIIAPNGLNASQYNIVLDDNGFSEVLPIQMMSTGMYNQSTLLSILVSMPKHGVLFIDELDAALHPDTIKSFLSVIKEKQIQTIMSLHNTFALQMLRPDQVYFAKWSRGFSNYYRLSQIYPNIREVNNIEKMYLSSLFDGVMVNDNK